MKMTQHLVKRVGPILLCQNNSLMMAPQCRNTWEFIGVVHFQMSFIKLVNVLIIRIFTVQINIKTT
jgi:hypothetical protein